MRPGGGWVALVLAAAIAAGLGGQAGAAQPGGLSPSTAAIDFGNELSYLPRFKVAYGHSTVPSRRVLANPLCPRAEIFGGHAICMAEFEYHHVWHLVAGTVSDQQNQNNTFTGDSKTPDSGGNPNDTGTVTFSRQWHRRFRPAPRGCRLHQLRGRLSSNDGACDALMADDLAPEIAHHERLQVREHGTSLKGFDPIVAYECTEPQHGRTITCRNAVGDAFRYTP